MNKAILILIILSLIIGSPCAFAMDKQQAQPERSEAWNRAGALFVRLQQLGGVQAARKAASAAVLQVRSAQLAQAKQQAEANNNANQASADQSAAKKEDEKQS